MAHSQKNSNAKAKFEKTQNFFIEFDQRGKTEAQSVPRVFQGNHQANAAKKHRGRLERRPLHSPVQQEVIFLL